MPLTLLVIAITVVAWVWLRSQPPSQRKPAIIKLALIASVLILALLAVTGRLNILFALLVFLLPLLRRVLPSLLMGRVAGLGMGGAKAKPGSQSHVSSDILDMTLDHDSGTMSGEVLKGPMAGRALADLGESDFIELLQYCRDNDEDSARLLETYLDRRFGDSWRADDPAGADDAAGSEREHSGSGGLTDSEALDILGLEAGASRDEIVQAHRRVMQKIHPDRGGSNYLAARVNEAKERLLS
ncbi:molecular chaperone DnaJ [Marinobacter sp.]|uniref:molecular chaperone DnaJ n=1 Tax=Marinobacter sp. TaxID=50741 RepID=UPI003A8F8FEA